MSPSKRILILLKESSFFRALLAVALCLNAPCSYYAYKSRVQVFWEWRKEFRFLFIKCVLLYIYNWCQDLSFRRKLRPCKSCLLFFINEGLGLLKLADTSLVLINPSPSSVRTKPPFWFRLRYRNRNWKLAETLGRYWN